MLTDLIMQFFVSTVFALYIKWLLEILGVGQLVITVPPSLHDLIRRIEIHTVGQEFEVILSLDREKCKELDGKDMSVELSKDHKTLYIVFRDPKTKKKVEEYAFKLPEGYTFTLLDDVEVENCVIYLRFRAQKQLTIPNNAKKNESNDRSENNKQN